jgi:hypothetical protein
MITPPLLVSNCINLMLSAVVASTSPALQCAQCAAMASVAQQAAAHLQISTAGSRDGRQLHHNQVDASIAAACCCHDVIVNARYLSTERRPHHTRQAQVMSTDKVTAVAITPGGGRLSR